MPEMARQPSATTFSATNPEASVATAAVAFHMKSVVWSIWAVATLASGFVAEKVVALGWRAISGKPAPREEDQVLNYKLAEIVTFAIISGATVTLVRELGLRQAAKWYSARRPDSPYAQRAISA